MPGTPNGEFYEMSAEDALLILAAFDECKAQLSATAEELEELRAAARSVVESHAFDAIARLLPKHVASLRLVK